MEWQSEKTVATFFGAQKVLTLKAGATRAVATVLYELTTNAAKYGALSNRSARVSVQWRWIENGSHDRLIIEWQETGGSLVLAPSQSGYGTSIIRELVLFEFGGRLSSSLIPREPGAGWKFLTSGPGRTGGQPRRTEDRTRHQPYALAAESGTSQLNFGDYPNY